MARADPDERSVTVHRPVVACPQIEHPGRRERRRGAIRSQGIRDRPNSRDVLYDAVAGRGRIVRRLLVAGYARRLQAGGIRLARAVDRAGSLHGEPFGDARDELNLEALDDEVRSVDIEGRVTEKQRAEQRQLLVLPLHVVRRHVEQQPVVEELALEADLVVDQVVGGHARGLQVLVAVRDANNGTRRPCAVGYLCLKVHHAVG